MQPRIAFRTHYQIDEPAYLELLIKLCTSPVQSTYREVVAQRLSKEIKKRGAKLNEDAAAYAVDLGKDLRLLTDNHTWTETGHLINLVAHIGPDELEHELTLSLPEKLLHFRVFLEGDGAAIVFLARRLIQDRSVIGSALTWNALAKEMFISVFSEYLAMTNNTADRVELRREIQRIKAKDYRGNSGEHKMLVHLQTLYRLGLVIRPEPSGSRTYQLPETQSGARCALLTIAEEVRDAAGLERVLVDHKWIEVAAKVFQIEARGWTNALDLASLVVPYYQSVMATGAPLCPISTLLEAVQIDLLSHNSQLLVWSEAVQALEKLQKQHPKDVRFHVDRRGQPAFVKISDEFVASCSEHRVEP